MVSPISHGIPYVSKNSQAISSRLNGRPILRSHSRSQLLDGMEDVSVKGGVIVAWGETDISDAASELHRRFEIGVTSTGRFHSVDPDKLTMAPYFAEVCASRILENSGRTISNCPFISVFWNVG